MSYLNRVGNSLVGGPTAIMSLGWLGDSITIADYFGQTGDEIANKKYSFASIVSSYYGANMNNQAQSGRIAASFLPIQTVAVGGAVKNFDGEILNDSGTWYWWNPVSGGAWQLINGTNSAIDRNGTNTANLDALINSVDTTHIIISQSGVNDNSANLDDGSGDFGAHGSRHYILLITEIVKRLKAANKTVALVTGVTSSDPAFHGFTPNYGTTITSRFSEASRQVAYAEKLNCCDCGVRLNIEITNGRVDILTRNSQVKPDNKTQTEWDAYLAGTGDPNAATNGFRVFDETEDYLHIEDLDRSPFWHNVHPNAFGHYLISNEIIKFINEKGFV